ncbi:recombinase family protein [Williamsia sp. M5A3_1d]
MPATSAIIYTRASRDNAKGRSVAEQEAECRAVCEREGWPVAEVICDNDRSASRYARKDRPGFDRLREIVAWGT